MKIKKTIYIIFTIFSILFSQKIVHMNGSYDLDGDQFLEFISLELNPNKDVFPTQVMYYEVNSDGYQNLIWEFKPPIGLEGQFVDAQIGELNGDGFPELIVTMNLSRFGDNTSPHVFVATYPWDGSNFSEVPMATIDIGKENRSLRCNNFQLLDQDSDGDQEILLSLGSPFRGFAVINLIDGKLSITKKVRPDELLVGSGLLYIGVVDYDRDGFDDVLALSPDGNTIKAQPFYNIGGVFDSGPLVIEKLEGLNGLLPFSINLTDWDADGFSDVLVPFKSGHLLAFTLTPATLVIDKVPISANSLTQIVLEDFNQDSFEDILMLSSDINSEKLLSEENERF